MDSSLSVPASLCEVPPPPQHNAAGPTAPHHSCIPVGGTPGGLIEARDSHKVARAHMQRSRLAAARDKQRGAAAADAGRVL